MRKAGKDSHEIAEEEKEKYTDNENWHPNLSLPITTIARRDLERWVTPKLAAATANQVPF
jgi:hypothetical protein